MKDTMEFFLELLNTRSVSGHTDKAMELVRSKLSGSGIDTRVTNKGSLVATIPGRSRNARVISAHIDTLGGMVSKIESSGNLKYRCIGGFTPNSIEGEYCLVETFQGALIPGTILFSKTSVHAWGREKCQEKRTHDTMYIRLDAEAASKEQVEKLGISVGNFVHFNSKAEKMASGHVKSRHIDDKAGVAILVAAAEELAGQAGELPWTVHFLFTVHEEVGHGAAGWLPENVSEFLAVDMGVCGSEQTSDERKVTICAADSSGPFNYRLTRKLIDLGEKGSIPFVVDTFPFYGSDAAAALRMGLDAEHALIGPGVDTSHAVERTHEDGMRATIDLVKAYSRSE